MFKKVFALLSLFTFAAFAAEPAAPAAPVAPLSYKTLIIPMLKAAGSGDMLNSVRQYVLRGQHVIYFCAKDGEELNATIKHFGDKSRPMSISYVFLDRTKNVLKKGIITYGKTETLTCKVEKGDTYALLINSGHGAAPWYSVATTNPFAVVASTGREIYLFTPQVVYTAGKAMNNSVLQVYSTPGESYAYSIDGAAKVALEMPKVAKIDLPEKAMVKVQFSRIPKKWCQNFIISFPGGRTPYLFFGENRAVDIVR